jgi:hypothetical protein
VRKPVLFATDVLRSPQFSKLGQFAGRYLVYLKSKHGVSHVLINSMELSPF